MEKEPNLIILSATEHEVLRSTVLAIVAAIDKGAPGFKDSIVKALNTIALEHSKRTDDWSRCMKISADDIRDRIASFPNPD